MLKIFRFVVANLLVLGVKKACSFDEKSGVL